MTRHRSTGEAEFGSDSFLDIVANIVGILIILIVIAGLRVSNAPVNVAAVPIEPEPSEPVVTEKSSGLSEIPPLVADVPTSDPIHPPAETSRIPSLPVPEIPRPRFVERVETPAPDPVVVPEPVIIEEPAVLEPPEPPRALVARSQELLGELESTRRTIAARAQAQIELDRRAASVEAKQAGISREMRDTNLDSAATRKRTADLSQGIDRKKAEMLNLEARLQTIEAQARPVRALKHRVTPISRTVQGRELHFRIKGGRIAAVPIEPLIERLKVQIQRQGHRLTRADKYEEMVGPVDGFSMAYTVRRAIVAGPGQFSPSYARIFVSRWEIKPEDDLLTETVETALSPHSTFIKVLQTAGSGATLTFWVYPDSFAAYRRLQSAAHNVGYEVAARPLPFGVPIAGSPSGTKSAGQ
ncbi:MAG: hypothetical protein CMJ48_00505 [Planctomycetaceae bacterium]|nr:hypothetical protein [Planctomycetaceae bacterium]